jgi:hypothetical protein
MLFADQCEPSSPRFLDEPIPTGTRWTVAYCKRKPISSKSIEKARCLRTLGSLGLLLPESARAHQQGQPTCQEKIASIYLHPLPSCDASRRGALCTPSNPVAPLTIAGRRLHATEFLCAHTIRLADEGLQRRVDVGGRHQTKVVAKPVRSIVLDASEESVLGAAPQPETRIQVRDTNDSTGKAHAGLNHDATLLRVGLYWTTLTGNGEPTIPRCLALGWLTAEVLGQRHSDAGVREILGDESMAASGTFPEWRF